MCRYELDPIMINRYLSSGYNPIPDPIFPEYKRFSVRLSTFEDVPPYFLEKPEPFVSAGFFCVNPDFDIACFYCGGMISEWHSNQNPWSIHVSLDKTCPFIKLIKGEIFIRHMLLVNQVLQHYEQEFPSNSG